MGEIIIKVPENIREVIEVGPSKEEIDNALKRVEKRLCKLRASKVALSLLGKVEDTRSYKEIKEEFYRGAY